VSSIRWELHFALFNYFKLIYLGYKIATATICMHRIHGIPDGLLDESDYGEDVSILLGENGSGKSSLLRKIAEYSPYITPAPTIAIANTIHDKFDLRKPNLRVLRASRGRGIAKQTIKDVLGIVSREGGSRFFNVAKILNHVGFNDYIGIRLKGLRHRNIENQLSTLSVIDSERDLIRSLLRRYADRRPYGDEIQRINLYDYDYYYKEFLGILEKEALLKRSKIFQELEVYLYRSGEPILINQASSGELTMITTFMFIAATIEPRSLILIDEPENSLHPKWQTEYVKLLMDYFHFFRPKVIIATHSPLVINAADIHSEHIKVYKGISGLFERLRSDIQNVEEMYKFYFDVITPKNRLLSEVVVRYLNLLSLGKIDQASYESEINKISDSAYSPEQKEVLLEFIDMGKKVSEARLK
jgi:predicted ATPase